MCGGIVSAARAGWLPTVLLDALDARQRLDNALLAAADNGVLPPCSDDPEQWFASDPDRIAIAVAGCARCPVLAQCRDYAADDTVTAAYGVWAGKPDDRQAAALDRLRRTA